MPEFFYHLIHAAEAHFFVASSVAFFVLGGILTYLADRAAQRRGALVPHLANHFFSWTHWRTPTVRIDFVFYLVAKYTQGYIAIISTFVTISIATMIQHGMHLWLHAPAHPPSGAVAFAAAAIAMFVFGDLGEFVSHVLQHTIKPLWEFHKVHHSSTFLTPLTTYRCHPVSNILDGLTMGVFASIPAGIAAFICGFKFDDLLLLSGTVTLAFTVGLLSVLQHSHFPISFGPLERLFVSPLMHQVHHSTKPEHWNKNYSSRLSIWDWCIGTAVILPKGEQVQFGLNPVEDQRADYTKLLWCYAGPFINCGKMLLRKPTQITNQATMTRPDAELG
jgi:sterol desaturase/sphingolipid hydroxylase (fatty acid hydroxylase superfamily)